jgi:hypothetical protein
MASSSFDWQDRNATLIREGHARVELFEMAEMAVVIVREFEPVCPSVRAGRPRRRLYVSWCPTRGVTGVHLTKKPGAPRNAAGFAYSVLCYDC